ncbi:WDR44 family WD repeat protein [Schizosaccharomyces octosporus yFS286]|uniref:WDR44 family WD repeat protein n=1 Tax=Schizosaccharomyces octosporus (strain yFS286) TaxID=483514 RepID=S9RJ21_SCHOY|nr:WDR44 family WD repeat protein [Schizosaccharomyces octosporus yFS286]EPX74009.1 WDR44 family WD repeat protein [Schizosaccharomyces octosporus yFS286]
MEVLLQDGQFKERMLGDPWQTSASSPRNPEGSVRKPSPVNVKRLPKRPVPPNPTIIPRNQNETISMDTVLNENSSSTSSPLNYQSENESNSDVADDLSLAETTINSSSSTAAEAVEENEQPINDDEESIQYLYPKHNNNPVLSRDHLRYVPIHRKRMPKNEMTLNRKLFVSQVINTGCTEASHEKKLFGKRLHRCDPADCKSSLWASEISSSGKYLATAGKDSVIRVWKVIENKKDRNHYFHEEISKKSSYFTGFSVFEPNPVLSCYGHKAEVLSISWSKNDFLLTASSDRTVRLWHPMLDRCLAFFQHNEIVTCVSFHPTDDRFFVSGTLDHRIHLWSVLEQKILHWNQLEYPISTICFQPDGQRIIVGLFYGMCVLYDVDQLRYISSWLIHRSSSRNRKSKITGLQCTNAIPGDVNSKTYVLVSTDDTSVRIFDVENRCMILKLGEEHRAHGQILSRLNEDNSYIISKTGSNEVMLWHLPYKFFSSTHKRRGIVRHLPIETFRICTERLTSAIIAPASTALEVSQSEGYVCPERDWKKPLSKNSEKTFGGKSLEIIIVSNMAGKVIVLRRDGLREKNKSFYKGSAKFRNFVHDWLHI